MNEQSIRDRLLEMEVRTPFLEEQFRMEMKKMLEKKLTPLGKIAWALTSLVGAFLVVRLSYMAIAIQEVPWLVRIGFIEGAVFSAGWVALGIWILKRGSFNFFRHENATHGLVFGFVFLLIILFAWIMWIHHPTLYIDLISLNSKYR